MFEWDENKNQATILDREISFDFVKRVWDDPNRMIVEENDRGNEHRWIIVGKIEGKHYTVVYTIREKYSIRIMSARRSRPKEIKKYATQ